MIQGYDWASMDGNVVNYNHVKGSFVIVRAAYVYKGICCADTTLIKERDKAQAAGFRFGAYMILGWNVHGPSPEDQARNFIAAYGVRREGELCPWLDLEADSAAAVGHTHQSALDWAHRAYDVLARAYGVVGTYTSCRVYTDVFGDLPSRLGQGPLWCKIPYPYKAGQAPHPEAYKLPTTLPTPWMQHGSPGLWIVQWQGDAKPVDGFSSTVDCNTFVTHDATNPLVWSELTKQGFADVKSFQAAHGLLPDNVLGPTTFCALAR